jgi:hypothetical protein
MPPRKRPKTNEERRQEQAPGSKTPRGKAPEREIPKDRPRSRLFVYDYNEDNHGKPDALGNVTDGVLCEVGRYQVVRFIDNEGNEIDIRNEDGELHLMARNFGLVIIPRITSSSHRRATTEIRPRSARSGNERSHTSRIRRIALCASI